MRLLLTVTTLSCLLGGQLLAQTPAPAPSKQEPAAAPKKLDPALYDHFGTGITEGKATPVAEALANAADFTGKVVRLEGTINEICQTKGCWMYLGDPKNPVMVKFKDYAFFMPKDGAGRTAIVEGTMAMKQETIEQTKHYLEDAGKLEEAKKVTEGRRIYTFMASGVALTKPQPKAEAK
jgi:hypothetical protein